ncbi:hypothetical protein KsCSTR_40330 [Candidatus Kuenenia stuttgartiensis]|uniref:Uncharacterized protein n=1 Tax=Kuenenia stuttgartiensis TaxID=174633 RepID=A0A6G7GVN3_KUEST|nr:hypothetical protein KsCSTR_40330 [Candidatus Kuenenia stuttgartiensis]
MPYNIKYFRGNVHVFLHIFVYYVLMENFDSAVKRQKSLISAFPGKFSPISLLDMLYNRWL